MTTLRRVLELPPREVLRRAAGRVGRHAANLRRAADALRPTYAPHADVPPGPLQRYLAPLPIDTLLPRAGELAEVCALFIGHRFDLLGSGWVRVHHGMQAAGLEGHRHPPGAPRPINRANRAESRRIRALLDDEYVPVDWQLDFRSGFRWSESAWARTLAYGGVPGADVKVPWELGRMQHLPQLACAHALAAAGAPGMAAPADYAGEFRRQVLDFVAANPPRFGVQWVLAMDVAIRAAGWVAAYDLFRAHGAAFGAEFERELARSLLDHGRYVFEYLEWSDGARGNHYLANVAGLLFIAAYLPGGAEADAWLAFTVRELGSEAALQFTPDGGNFEASTCYHRLSAEMVGYATALALALPPERRPAGPLFPPDHFERLERAAELMVHATAPIGRAVQIGDNDSGRFLKLLPPRRRTANGWEEDFLDFRDTVAALDGLLTRPELAAFAGGFRAEAALTRALAGAAPPPPPPRPTPAARVRTGNDEVWTALADAPGGVWELAAPGADLCDGARLFAYPDFGLYLFHSARLFLAIRCGGTGRIGGEGHAHLDELSLTLALDGTEIIRDPGTYVYTPLPHRRNEYRSARAHFVPRPLAERPAAPLSGTLFELRSPPRGECLYWGARGFAGRVRVDGTEVLRTVKVLADRIVVTDRARKGSQWMPVEAPTIPSIPFSPAYGRRDAG